MGPRNSRPSRKLDCTFTESEYDRERYRKILQISVEIFAEYSGQSPSLIQGLFENQSRIRYAEGRRSRRSIPKREVATCPGTDRRAVDLARRLGGRK